MLMAGGDAHSHSHSHANDPPRPAADAAFLRFLIPAPKPRPRPLPAAPAGLHPPHRLIAPPAPVPALLRPEERLFIVPPTRPDWLPPPLPPPPPPPPRPHHHYHSRPSPSPDGPRARDAAGRFASVHANGAMLRDRSTGGVGAFPLPRDGGAGARPGFQRFHRPKPKPKGAAAPPPPPPLPHKEKKAWVAVQRKAEGAGDEDRAVLSEGYSGGDEGGGEAEDLLGLDGEQEQEQDGGDHQDDVKNSLPMDGNATHGCSGGDPPSELTPQPNQVPRLRGRTRSKQAECRHDIGTFTTGLLALYESLKPSEDHKSKQKQLVDSLAKSVSKEWPNSQLHLYGSCANSFGTSHSDVDVCLEMEIGTQTAAEVLLRLADVLRTDGFENVEAITSARVPIVRMSPDPGSSLSCDICINNLLAVANTKLLKDYGQIDQRLPQLALLVKHWAKRRGVNETYRGTLSSYAYVLMCISFLQLREPKILPCLQAMEPTYTLTVDGTECAYFDKVHQLQDFGADNKDSIAELLRGFFHCWASQHHYKHDVISVRMGKTISKQEKNWTTRVGNDRHLMCIEDPFETGHDLGRVVDRQTIRVLREELERAAAVLQYDDDPCVTLFEPYGSDED